MGCPRCSSELTGQKGADGSRLLCLSCGGFWIDAGPLAAALKNRGVTMPAVSGEPGGLLCPRDGARLIPFEFREVTLDSCPGCGGLWLDKGEWKKILSGEGAAGSRKMKLAAGVAGVAAAGGVAAAAAAGQAEQQESGSRALDVAECVFDCLCEIVGSLDI